MLRCVPLHFISYSFGVITEIELANNRTQALAVVVCCAGLKLTTSPSIGGVTARANSKQRASSKVLLDCLGDYYVFSGRISPRVCMDKRHFLVKIKPPPPDGNEGLEAPKILPTIV
jgi:hypothetical protein